MQYHWLNKQNNDNLIVFFAGWSFDYKPFEFLDCGDYDVLAVFDYNDLSFDVLKDEFVYYKHKSLITWSMGVYAAYRLRKILPDFDKKIAINGTVFPVDNKFGIPEKPFLLTLKHCQKGLEGKFYQNIFDKPSDYERYIKTPVERSIENRVSELESVNLDLSTFEKVYEKYYDFAYVSLKDGIIPSNNQINFWQNYETDYTTLDSGHFPYYNFKSWKDLL